VQTKIQFAAALLQLIVVWHLWRTQLLFQFRFLAAHMVALFGWFAVTSLKLGDPLMVWKIGAVATMATLMGAFLETVYRSLEHYPGLSLRAVLAACGIVVSLSGVLGALEPSGNAVRGLLVAQRILGLAVAVNAISLVLVLNYLDPRRRPNVVRHERIMASMAAVTALAAWMENHRLLAQGSILLQAGSLLFPALWIWALRREGERDTRPPADPSGRNQASAAKDQLWDYYG